MPTPQSLTEIAAALEAAIRDANVKKAKAEEIVKQVAAFEDAYKLAVDAVQALNAKYTELLAQTMNSYGLNAVATSFRQVHK